MNNVIGKTMLRTPTLFSVSKRISQQLFSPCLCHIRTIRSSGRQNANSGNPDALRPSPYDNGIFRSNAEKLIGAVPVIEVDGITAVCDGGGGALGHPIEYIQLNLGTSEPAVCKYCGLRYKK
eukprot:gene22090-28598_t